MVSQHFAAFLRAVNLGGRTSVAMSDLRSVAESCGFLNGRTLLQSGNLVFSAESGDHKALETTLTRIANEKIRPGIEFFVRTQEELENLVAANPFQEEAESDPSHLVVLFLREAPLPNDVSEVQTRVHGPERIAVGEKHLYVTYPDGIGESTLPKVPGWKALGGSGTGRNWNTVLKVVKALQELPE